MRVAPHSLYAFRLAFAALCAFGLAACDKVDTQQAVMVSGGNAAQGKKLLVQYQCGSCHVIPGIAGARGTAGPSLDKFGRRSYINGGFPNHPDVLIAWIIDPPAMKKDTLMPNVGVTGNDARQIAAYLFTLR